MIDEESLLTPEWLRKAGYEDFTEEMAPPAFDVDISHADEDDFLLIEKGIHRNLFFIIMTRNYCGDGTQWYRTRIFMQHDVGCGFNRVPNPNISEWTILRFKALFYALRENRPTSYPIIDR